MQTTNFHHHFEQFVNFPSRVAYSCHLGEGGETLPNEAQDRYNWLCQLSPDDTYIFQDCMHVPRKDVVCEVRQATTLLHKSDCQLITKGGLPTDLTFAYILVSWGQPGGYRPTLQSDTRSFQLTLGSGTNQAVVRLMHACNIIPCELRLTCQCLRNVIIKNFVFINYIILNSTLILDVIKNN